MPPQLSCAAASASGWQPWVEAGVRWLAEHQTPADCTKARLLVVGAEHMEIHPNEGMGSTVHLIARRLALAVSLNRVLVIADGTWAYGGPQEASLGRWRSVFQHGACTLQHAQAGQASGAGPGDRVIMHGSSVAPKVADEYLDMVPAHFKVLGWRGWWTILLAYLMRMRPDMQAQVASYFGPPPRGAAGTDGASPSASASVPWGGNFTNPHLLALPGVAGAGIIGMHARFGERPDELKRSWDTYLAAVRSIAATTGARKLMVASDDAGVLELAAALPDFAVLVIPTRVRRRAEDAGRGMSIVLHEGSPQRRSDGTSDALAVIYGLARCNYFISTCMSQIARTAAALQEAAGCQRRAPLAVDDSSCFCEHKHYTPVVEAYVPAKGSYVTNYSNPLPPPTEMAAFFAAGVPSTAVAGL